MTDTKDLKDTAAAIEAGRQIGERSIQTINGIPVLVARDDIKHTVLEQLLDHPMMVRETVIVTDQDSFIAYHNAFASESSLIRYDLINGILTSALDYHTQQGHASHNKHTLTFAVAKTVEWNTWNKNSGKRMSQLEFAEFIEDNLDEIVDPDGATMLEIAQSITGTQSVKFTRGIRLHNGQQQIEYIEEIDGQAGPKGSLRIPEQFTISVEPYRGAGLRELTARFRYRIRHGELNISYHLHRPEKVFQDAVEETANNIRREARGPLFICA